MAGRLTGPVDSGGQQVPPEPGGDRFKARAAVIRAVRPQGMGGAPLPRIRRHSDIAAALAIEAPNAKTRIPLFKAISGFCEMVGATGIEPVTPTMST